MSCVGYCVGKRVSTQQANENDLMQHEMKEQLNKQPGKLTAQRQRAEPMQNTCIVNSGPT
jgi:hypothetical protein